MVKVPKLTVTLEAVTPLFLGGANPGGTSELRAPSFRGVLRYWWRAWYTGQRGGVSRDELYTAESVIFGNTDAASSLVARLQGQPPRISMERPEQPTGLNYLMYGMYERKKKQKKTVLEYRPAIEPGERFDLILSVRPTQKAYEVLRQAAISLWLLCNLGGVGARVRRGAGALCAVEPPVNWPKDLPSLDLQALSPVDLRQKLGESLKRLVGDVDEAKDASTPSLHRDLCNVSVFEKSWSSWEDALEEVGQAFQHFRNRRDPDYTGVKQFIQGGAPPETVRRAAFGLPLPFYYRSLQKEYQKQGYDHKTARQLASARIQGESHNGREIVDRSASPLRFRVVRLANGRYAVLLTVFTLLLLPAKSQLRLTSPSRAKSAKVPGQDIIADFRKYAEQQIAALLEVKY